MKFFVYIIYSRRLGKYYVGSTQDIENRLKKYLSNHKGFTSKTKDWVLKYHKSFSAKPAALKREFQIKKWKS